MRYSNNFIIYYYYEILTKSKFKVGTDVTKTCLIKAKIVVGNLFFINTL